MEQLKKRVLSVLSLAFVAAVAAGAASANVTAKAESMNDFAITATSVRLDNPSNDYVDSGLRFKVDCPTSEVEAAYTVLTMTTAAGVYQTAQVDANVWRPDGSGWNTVVANIPDTDYVTEITAQAFVTVNGVTYETQAVTSSIAKTASWVLNADKDMQDEVGHYVAGQVQSITLDVTANLKKGETAQLNVAVAPAGYGVVWSSNDTGVATVDKDGNVKAVGVGEASITASMGGVSATCEVTVEDYFDGTMESWSDAEAAELFTIFYAPAGTFEMGLVEDPLGENGKVFKLERKNTTASAPNIDFNVPTYLLNKLVAGNILSMNVYSVNGTNLWIKAGSTNLWGHAIISNDGWTKIEVQLTDALVSAIKANNNKIRFEMNGNPHTYYFDDIKIAEPVFDGTFESMTDADVKVQSFIFSGSAVYGIATDPTNANNKVLKVERQSTKIGFGLYLPKAFLEKVVVGNTISMKVYSVGGQTGDLWIKTLPHNYPGTNKNYFSNDAIVSNDGWTTLEVELTKTLVDAIQADKVIYFEFNKAINSTYYFDDLKISEPPAFDGTFETVTDADTQKVFKTYYAPSGSFEMGLVADPLGENGNVFKMERKSGYSGSAPLVDFHFPADLLEKVVAGNTLSMKVYSVNAGNGLWIKTNKFLATDSKAVNLWNDAVVSNAGWTTYEVKLTDALVAKLQETKTIHFEFNSAGTYYFDDLKISEPPAFDGTFETVTDADAAGLFTISYAQTAKFEMGLVADPLGENGKVFKMERKDGHQSAPNIDFNVPADMLNKLVAGNTLSMKVYSVNGTNLWIKAGSTNLWGYAIFSNDGWTKIEVTLTDALVSAIKANNNKIRFEMNGSAHTYYFDSIEIK